MISKSALLALTGLVEAVREHDALVASGAPFAQREAARERIASHVCSTLPDLRAILQSLEPTEARAEAEGFGEFDGRKLLTEEQQKDLATKPVWTCPFCTIPLTESGTAWTHYKNGCLIQSIELKNQADIGWWNLCCRVRYGRIASPLPKAETQPVAWRAWAKPVPGRKWPSDQWVYWDEEPTTIQDDPEFSQFQALYTHPSPLPEAATIDAAIASEVMIAIRAVRQDVRPYMRHLEDCELVRFRQGYYSPSETKCPPCSCGLEKVLWDIPAEIETGKTK